MTPQVYFDDTAFKRHVTLVEEKTVWYIQFHAQCVSVQFILQEMR